MFFFFEVVVWQMVNRLNRIMGAQVSGDPTLVCDVETSQVGTLVEHDLKTRPREPWSTWPLATPISNWLPFQSDQFCQIDFLIHKMIFDYLPIITLPRISHRIFHNFLTDKGQMFNTRWLRNNKVAHRSFRIRSRLYQDNGIETC